jgi:hypothetical protein
MNSPTREQRQVALAHANVNRLKLAATRREIGEGKRLLSDLIENPPEWFSVLTYDALLMMPLFGKHKLRAFNAHAMFAHVNIAAPITDLSPGSRKWLVEWVREYEGIREEARLKKAHHART